MTEKEKKLLLKDLSARIPFGVDVEIDNNFIASGKNVIRLCEVNCGSLSYLVEKLHAKPILRPMSSMTKEEREEYCSFDGWTHLDDGTEVPSMDQIDWLNEKEFDYRGLIDIDVAYSKKIYRYA